MINDAAAIVAYRMAVAAAVTGTFSLGDAGLRFLVMGAGGVVVGLAVGWLLAAVRRHIHDPEVENTISLLSGYAAYLPAERLGVSGILAVFAMGIYLGRVGPRFVAADTRVQNAGMWDVVVFVLEGLIFVLTGLALRPIVEGLTGAAALELARAAVLVSLAVIIARLLWFYFAGNFRWLLGPWLRPREQRPRWQVLTVGGWVGLRGGVTLILAASIPTVTAAGTPFPGRDTIIAVSYRSFSSRCSVKASRWRRSCAGSACARRATTSAARSSRHASTPRRRRWRGSRSSRRSRGCTRTHCRTPAIAIAIARAICAAMRTASSTARSKPSPSRACALHGSCSRWSGGSCSVYATTARSAIT